MAHHIFFAEEALGDALHAREDANGLLEAAGFTVGQVDLGHVAGDDGLGAEADAGEEHFHLLRGGVLGLIQDNKAVIERAPAHIGKRRNLNGALFHVLLKIFRAEHIKQAVVQRAEIGIDFALQVAGQEAQLFAGFDSRAG